MNARGIDLEIVELGKPEDAAVVAGPTKVIINGQEVLVADHGIQLGEISRQDVFQVTLTLFVNSLKIYREC